MHWGPGPPGPPAPHNTAFMTGRVMGLSAIRFKKIHAKIRMTFLKLERTSSLLVPWEGPVYGVCVDDYGPVC